MVYRNSQTKTIQTKIYIYYSRVTTHTTIPTPVLKIFPLLRKSQYGQTHDVVVHLESPFNDPTHCKWKLYTKASVRKNYSKGFSQALYQRGNSKASDCDSV